MEAVIKIPDVRDMEERRSRTCWMKAVSSSWIGDNRSIFRQECCLQSLVDCSLKKRRRSLMKVECERLPIPGYV